MRTLCVDIDGVLTRDWKSMDFENRRPHKTNIARLADVYATGMVQVVLWTARPGSIRKQTVKWLEDNNVSYHELWMDKPSFVAIVDDRSMTSVPTAKQLTELRGWDLV